MSEQEKPFVINDRRKFRMDGDSVEHVRQESSETENTAAVETSPTESVAGNLASADARRDGRSEPIPFPSRASGTEEKQTEVPHSEESHFNAAHMVTPVPEPTSGVAEPAEGETPAGPTPEQTREVREAYERTVERLDIAVRSANPGADHAPPMDFTRLVQSIYMTALVQLGYGSPEGDAPHVDLIGAKQSIDMLGVISEKTGGNLSTEEQRLIDSALFELRMAFLELVQALSRQAHQRQPGPGMPGSPFPPPGGPKIVR